MTNQYLWDTTLLPDTTYYKRVLADGCSVQFEDITMCDLRHFVYSRRNEKFPLVQVYIENKKFGRQIGQEITKIFRNFDEGISYYLELINERKAKKR